jgi:hypothetical protein
MSLKPTAAGRRRLNAALGRKWKYVGTQFLKSMSRLGARPSRHRHPLSELALHVLSAARAGSSAGMMADEGFGKGARVALSRNTIRRIAQLRGTLNAGSSQLRSVPSPRQYWRHSNSTGLRPNYAFKPTAGEVFRTNQPLRTGGGLTRRWAANA